MDVHNLSFIPFETNPVTIEISSDSSSSDSDYFPNYNAACRKRRSPDVSSRQDVSNAKRKKLHDDEKSSSCKSSIVLDDSVSKVAKKTPLKKTKQLTKKKCTGKPLRQRIRTGSQKQISIGDSSSDEFSATWNISDELASQFNISHETCGNITRLLNEDNTIPFIARYRNEQTNNMNAEVLRNFSTQYDTLRLVQEKIKKVAKIISDSQSMTSILLKGLLSSRTLEEVDYFHEPFKQHKDSLANTAKASGLEEPAMIILNNLHTTNIRLDKYINPNVKGVDTLPAVELGITYIISEHIAKDYEILKMVSAVFTSSRMHITSRCNRNLNKKLEENESKDSKLYKFELYYDFSRSAKLMQPHQVLAINRGVSQKVLKKEVVIPDECITEFLYSAYRHICQNRNPCQPHIERIVRSSIQYCCDHSIVPSVRQKVWRELTKMAEKSSVETFAKNLHNLLMTSPIRGQVIMAIDPGFTQGCKIAVVSPSGSPLYTTKAFLHSRNNSYVEIGKLVDAVFAYRCEVIAIGNGVGCRETEDLIHRLIKEKSFSPLDVCYCIVNESGVSVYSVSEVAASDFPDLDPTQRSAISLGRRLIDPLSEYVKVDPKHLGIGMYQHDISESSLRKTLEGVVQESVSFVGVDINIASEKVLSKVAGMTTLRAANIVKFRDEYGAIINRQQLMLVPGIGPVTYRQCAGFMRISKRTLDFCLESAKDRPKQSNILAKKSVKKSNAVDFTFNPLDCTSIHPESYDIANKIIEECGLKSSFIGTPSFIEKIKNFFSYQSIEKYAAMLNVGVPTLTLIANGLQRDLDFDVRGDFNKPLFKRGIASLDCLQLGMIVSGKVMNVTTFGVFVDVGVGRDGLIHNTKMKQSVLQGKVLCVGDCVSAKVLKVDTDRHLFGLELVAVDKLNQPVLS